MTPPRPRAVLEEEAALADEIEDLTKQLQNARVGGEGLPTSGSLPQPRPGMMRALPAADSAHTTAARPPWRPKPTTRRASTEANTQVSTACGAALANSTRSKETILGQSRSVPALQDAFRSAPTKSSAISCWQTANTNVGMSREEAKARVRLLVKDRESRPRCC